MTTELPITAQAPNAAEWLGAWAAVVGSLATAAALITAALLVRTELRRDRLHAIQTTMQQAAQVYAWAEPYGWEWVDRDEKTDSTEPWIFPVDAIAPSTNKAVDQGVRGRFAASIRSSLGWLVRGIMPNAPAAQPEQDTSGETARTDGRDRIGLVRRRVTVTNASDGPIYHVMVSSQGNLLADQGRLDGVDAVSLLRPGQSYVWEIRRYDPGLVVGPGISIPVTTLAGPHEVWFTDAFGRSWIRDAYGRLVLQIRGNQPDPHRSRTSRLRSTLRTVRRKLRRHTPAAQQRGQKITESAQDAMGLDQPTRLHSRAQRRSQSGGAWPA